MLDTVQVNSLGFRTDLMLRRLEGGRVVDHGDYLTVHSPGEPTFRWGNFLLMHAARSRRASSRPGSSSNAARS